MAKKKGGFGRFLGAITGTPYERLLKQIEKAEDNIEDDDDLAIALEDIVDKAREAYDEEEIDEEEHDLILEAVEEADPLERTFAKISGDVDEFYEGDVPNAPELKREKRANLDDLMRAKGDEFLGSFGREEFDEFRERMTEEFYQESDDAIRQGDHQAEIRTSNRVFGGAEDDVDDAKRRIAEETGMADPNAAPEEDDEEYDDSYSIDENGVEWFEDEDGYWWYREEGQTDWQPYDDE